MTAITFTLDDAQLRRALGQLQALIGDTKPVVQQVASSLYDAQRNTGFSVLTMPTELVKVHRQLDRVAFLFERYQRSHRAGALAMVGDGLQEMRRLRGPR